MIWRVKFPLIFNDLDDLIGLTVNIYLTLYKSVFRILDSIKIESNNSNVNLK